MNGQMAETLTAVSPMQCGGQMNGEMAETLWWGDG